MMDKDRTLRIGTRGSPLALAQARLVQEALAAAHPALKAPGAVEIVVIRTTGDRILDRALSEIGGKGLFTKEIEEALLDGRIDLAVHSMKDMPVRQPDGLAITAMLPREDPRDVLIARAAGSLAELPQGCLIGTASLRRAAQVRAMRPDVRTTILRGSVQTRLRKLEEGEVEATFLAAAGLIRLGRAEVASAVLEVGEMLPAVGQGAVGIETPTDSPARDLLAAIDHRQTHEEVLVERAFMAGLDGSCRTPIAGYCRREDGALRFSGLVARPDGSEVRRLERSGDDPAALAAEVGEAAEAMRAELGPDFMSVDGAGA